jgi:hypothetical protein
MSESNNKNNNAAATSSRILAPQDADKLTASRTRLCIIVLSLSVVCGIIISIFGTTIFSNLPETISAGVATSFSIAFLLLQINLRRRRDVGGSSELDDNAPKKPGQTQLPSTPSSSSSTSSSSFSYPISWYHSSYYEIKVLIPFTAGLTLWFVAELTYSYYQVALKIAIPYPSIADPIFLLGYCFFIYSFYIMLKYIRKSLERDVIIFGSVAVSVSLAFILQLSIGIAQMIAPVADQIANILSIIYPVLDGILFIPALVILWSIRNSPSVEESLIYSHWIFISIFIILNTIADVGYGYSAIVGSLGENEWIWDILFSSAYITIAAALFWQLMHYQTVSEFIRIKEGRIKMRTSKDKDKGQV